MHYDDFVRWVESGQPTRRVSVYERLFKRPLDLLVASAALVALAPVALVVAFGVLVSMGRPVLFKQERYGLRAEPFEVLKFRSMKPDRRKADLPFDGPDRRKTHKSDDDPRHTRFGRFIRYTSLDEIPQLWNVVRGEMSLVGPRPELSSVADSKGLREHARHDVKPGITGVWQVFPERTNYIYEHVALDAYYAYNVCFMLDLKMIIITVYEVAHRVLPLPELRRPRTPPGSEVAKMPTTWPASTDDLGEHGPVEKLEPRPVSNSVA